MPRVSYDPDSSSSDFVTDDSTPLKRRATTEPERRRTLSWCVDSAWADEDIGCIERIETKTQAGWRMFSYREPEST